jgi:Tfp pilus assembly protein PilE
MTSRPGLTLGELVVVLAILTVLASLILPAAGNFLGESRDAVTRQSLTRLRDVIAETYCQDSFQQLPRPNLSVSPSRIDYPQIRYLLVNPATEDTTVQYDPAHARGWRGPYVVDRGTATYTVNAAAGFTEPYGENGDPAIPDGWGRPIVIQHPGVLADGRQDVRLVSAGPNGIVNIPADKPTSALTADDAGDDVWIAFQVR